MFSIIVAIGNNNEIGKDNKLLWHIPEDLKNFKEITTGKTIIMGRKTYESIGKPLPNRKNIVLTRDKETFSKKNEKWITDGKLEVFDNFDEIIDKYNGIDNEIFVIGGEQIYKKALEKQIVEKLYISHIDFNDLEADAFFPKIDYIEEWTKESEKKYDSWKFCTYIRNVNY